MEDAAAWRPNCDGCKKLLARAVKNYAWACDTCDNDFARDTEAFECKHCQFDRCPACRGDARQKSPRRARRVPARHGWHLCPVCNEAMPTDQLAAHFEKCITSSQPEPCAARLRARGAGAGDAPLACTETAVIVAALSPSASQGDLASSTPSAAWHPSCIHCSDILVSHVKPREWVCDKCDRAFPALSEAFSCAPCTKRGYAEYDVCAQCRGDASSPSSARRRASRMKECPFCQQRFGIGDGILEAHIAKMHPDTRAAPAESGSAESIAAAAGKQKKTSSHWRPLCQRLHCNKVLTRKLRDYPWVCDICEGDFSSGSTAFSCTGASCDFDVCKACRGNPDAPSPTRARKVTREAEGECIYGCGRRFATGTGALEMHCSQCKLNPEVAERKRKRKAAPESKGQSATKRAKKKKAAAAANGKQSGGQRSGNEIERRSRSRKHAPEMRAEKARGRGRGNGSVKAKGKDAPHAGDVAVAESNPETIEKMEAVFDDSFDDAAGSSYSSFSDASGERSDEGPLYFMYRYILRESCSQFDSLPLTSLR